MGLFDRFFAPPTEAKFAQRLINAIRRHADGRTFVHDPSESQIVLNKQGEVDWIINLGNLFAEYRGLEQSKRAAWLKRTAKGLFPSSELPNDFVDVRPHLRLSLRPRLLSDLVKCDVEEHWSKRPELASVPVSKHLIACLVFDRTDSIQFVNVDALETWGVSLYEAFEAARYNLDECPRPLCASLDDRLYLFQAADGYDATRMLSLDLIRGLKVNGPPLALPLTRDCLLVTGADDVAGQEMMVALAEKWLGDPRPLCSIAHTLVDDEWTPWSAARTHPQYEKFCALQLHHIGREYAEQQQALVKRNERIGIDIFVASFFTTEFDATQGSCCVWSKSVPSWLPKTDMIAFCDPLTDTTKGLVPWDTVVREFGHAMQPLDYWPPRWSIDSFPTDDQLAKMRPRLPRETRES